MQWILSSRLRRPASLHPLEMSSNPRLREFNVSISDEKILDLKERLEKTRWPDQLQGVGWEYGSNLEQIKELAAYWQHAFDWRKAEARINSFNNYKLLINGIDIHFIHERSPDPNALPLIFTHGWPGSFLESLKLIKLLTQPSDGKRPSFHVVAPSLPGFGFSSAPTDPGFGVIKTAETFNQLMLALGYPRYVAQGGDIGAMVSCLLGANHSAHCKAVHLNYIPISFGFGMPSLTNPWHVASFLNAKLPIVNWFPVFISQEEMGYLESNTRFFERERAYATLQATKPQTIGYGLNDSPAGLLAYIAEKFRTWSDCGGHIERKFSKDDLLTNISLYWFNENITSSFRMYYESQGPHSKDRDIISKKRVQVPVGVATFEKEIFKSPRQWAESWLNIKQWTKYKTGGHFAALEEPQLLAEDLSKFFAVYH